MESRLEKRFGETTLAFQHVQARKGRSIPRVKFPPHAIRASNALRESWTASHRGPKPEFALCEEPEQASTGHTLQRSFQTRWRVAMRRRASYKIHRDSANRSP